MRKRTSLPEVWTKGDGQAWDSLEKEKTGSSGEKEDSPRTRHWQQDEISPRCTLPGSGSPIFTIQGDSLRGTIWGIAAFLTVGAVLVFCLEVL